MTFNSYIFILFFVPLCLTGYYLLNHKNRHVTGNVFLIVMSLWFYGYFNLRYLVVIIASVAFNYVAYRLMEGMRSGQKMKRVIFTLGLCFNLGLLCYFKYMDFFIRSINRLFSSDIPLLHILLPLGISFFTFQQISFIVDAYHSDHNMDYSLIDYAAYVTFFPQLVAGPIVTHDALIPQLKDINRKCMDFDYMSKGLFLFVLGLSKKVLIADTFGKVVDIGYENIATLNTVSAFITLLSYTLQIYFDFSGYSDMAIGLGWMLHIDLPVNFDSPYKTTSVTDFWKRWHITLTNFFTKYVYIPLGGSRRSRIRTYLNIVVVFFLSGLWHGAGWTFIIWGLCHGTAQIVERIGEKVLKRINPIIKWIVTFVFLNITWVFFRAEGSAEAIALIRRLLVYDSEGIDYQMVDVFSIAGLTVTEEYPFVVMLLYYTVALTAVIAMPNAKQIAERFFEKWWTAPITAALLVICLFCFSGVSTFLYFNF